MGHNVQVGYFAQTPAEYLDGKHTVFGNVVDASDQAIVNAIAKGDKIQSVKIIRNGEKAKAFKGGEVHFNKF